MTHVCKFSQIETKDPGLITVSPLTTPLDVHCTQGRGGARQPPSKEEQFPKYDATVSSNCPVLPSSAEMTTSFLKVVGTIFKCYNFQKKKNLPVYHWHYDRDIIHTENET